MSFDERWTGSVFLWFGSLLCSPDDFVCVCSVVLSDGFTYERTAIEQWISGHNTSPMLGLRLSSKTLVPNFNLRSQIRDWVSKHGKDSMMEDDPDGSDDEDPEIQIFVKTLTGFVFSSTYGNLWSGETAGGEGPPLWPVVTAGGAGAVGGSWLTGGGGGGSFPEMASLDSLWNLITQPRDRSPLSC